VPFLVTTAVHGEAIYFPPLRISILLKKTDSVAYEKWWWEQYCISEKEADKRLTAATILRQRKVKALKMNENQRPCRKE
jgi:hypothetical protein